MTLTTLTRSGVAALPLLALTAPAAAALSAIGAVDPATGFPAYVQDASNVQLGPCNRVDPINEGGDIINDFPCGGLELDDPFGAFVEGNIAEFTYYRAEANIVDPVGGGETRTRLRMEVQGGLLPPANINNAVRLVARDYPAGTLTIVHPFGTDTFEMNGVDRLDTELPGGVLGQFPNFNPARNGNIECFWSNGTEVQVDGLDYLGDGLTEQPLIPDPNCLTENALELVIDFDAGSDGPGPGDFTTSTDLFAVEAKLLTGPGVSVERATYERNATGANTKVDVFAKSVPGQTILVSGLGLSTDPVMVEGMDGNYYLRRRVAGNGGPPDDVSVTGAVEPATLVDEVMITTARYAEGTGRLLVKARSSDRRNASPPVLRASDQDGNSLGALSGGTLDISGVPFPPSEITVSSSAGGSATVIVDITGGNVVQ